MTDTQLSSYALNRALEIHQELTRLVPEGGDYQKLADMLATRIQHSISIEDADFQRLANCEIGEGDTARQYTIQHGETDPRLVAALEERGILDEIRHTKQPVMLDPIPEAGLELARILAPIVVRGEIFGYFWIIASDRQPLTRFERVAIDSGATVAALLMLRRQIEEDAQNKLKGDLISQLLKMSPENPYPQATSDALRYGVDLKLPFVMLCVGAIPEGVNPYSLGREIAQVVAAGRMVFGMSEKRLVGLVNQSDELMTRAENVFRTTSIVNWLKSVGSDAVQIALSAPMHDAGAVAHAFQQCQDTFTIARRLGMQARVLQFERLGYLHTLYLAGEQVVDTNPYVPKLEALKKEVQADLLHTLEVYLDAGANGVQTAERLNVHRSTLNYRLQRIEDVCAVDLGDPVERTNLQVGIKLIRLFPKPGA